MNPFHQILEKIQGKSSSLSLSGLIPAASAYCISQIFPLLHRSILVISPNMKEAESFASDLKFFSRDDGLVLFPNLDVLPYFQLSPHPDILTQRLALLFELLQSHGPKIIVSSLAGALRRLPPKSIFNDYADFLMVKEEVDRQALLLKLLEAGYLPVSMVEEPGTYAARGEIIDIFPPQSAHPFRIQLFGDLVESIRLFEPATQKSLREVAELIILPAREVVLNEKNIQGASARLRARFDEVGLSKAQRDQILGPLKNRLPFAGLETFLSFFYESTATLFDYLKPDSLLFLQDFEALAEHRQKMIVDLEQSQKDATSPERIVNPRELFLSEEEWKEKTKKFFCIETYQIDSTGPVPSHPPFRPIHLQTNEILRTKILPPSAGLKMLDPLVEVFKQWLSEGKQLLLVASSESQKLRLMDLLTRHALAPQEIPDFQSRADLKNIPHGNLYVTESHLSKGFHLEEDRFVFITDEELFGSKTRRLSKAKIPSQAFSAFEELQEGDYVVHMEHGLSIYKGLKTLNWEKMGGEFLQLEFLGSDKLYLPVYRLNLISRYTGDEGQVPSLDKLGGSQWLKTQEKVKKSIRAIAGELLKIYAARASQIRKPFGVDTEIYEEFEASFPYEETPDQEKAIQEVLQDMENEKVMDRLICGDVGYGKTEVALRAAFKAVMDGRQVAVLVPTTILAFQHYETFGKRFKNYGVEVEMLSRFRSPAEQKQIIERANQGQVDVLIGTHRLLQNDLKFKNLGLLVIDEEQRFGVSHKEKIKKMRNLVDVLTLSATPIPRTLNMSLFGIRDLSVISTPPADREAIRTYVAQFDEALIRDAVMRELRRGGQVFFVHNRVQTIHAMVDRLRKLVPEASIGVGHGQMEDEALEEAMIHFLEKKSNLFLCTSIIESGLDFPSANTILINRADHFGLAQLYQLRGRVGRSNVQAYCYLLIPAESGITADARSRLSVLQRFTELGSGFKIAAHDLEIRGAGNILGIEQHGQIAAVGYEMYMRLLEEAIAEIKGEEKAIEVEPELNFMIPARLTEEYVSEPSLRLGLYKRISQADNEEVLDALKLEIEDRFGKAPSETLNLVALMRIRLVAKRLLIESIHQEKTRMIYKFHPKTPLPPDSLIERMKKSPKKYQLTTDFKWVTPQTELSDEKILESVYQFLIGLEEEIPSSASID